MKETDNKFIAEVVDFYYSTIDEAHPQGNMSAVAEHFSAARSKIHKILITAGVIDSPLHQDIMKLKNRGYDTDDIALALGVSAATVKMNMPYEKVIYNSEKKSCGAEYVENYRKREKIFMTNVVRPKTPFEDDPMHLMPVYTEEESEFFKMRDDVMLLHIEFDADLTEVRKLAKIKCKSLFDENRYTISRDILVPYNIPLHNLHYALNQAFGFTNSHLHEYTLNQKDLTWITQDKVSRWKKLLGLVFKNPYRDENLDFWDDDYDGGSPKKWMRSKYTGPEYEKIFEESYPYIKEEVRAAQKTARGKIKAKSVAGLRMDFYLNPLAVNETLPVSEILSENGQEDYDGIKDYDECMKECICEAARFPEESMGSQPFVYAFAETLNYCYDFGDNWNLTIKAFDNAEYLEGRVTAEQIREAIKDVCVIARPVVIAADGLPLIEDVGGVYGYMDFLKGTNGLPSSMYEDKEESLAWAKWNGWPGKIGALRTML